MKRSSRWFLILLMAVAAKQAIVISILPPWQVPDEPAHVGYVQALVEDRRLPVFSSQRMDLSAEMVRSLTEIEDANPQRLGRHYPPGFVMVAGETDRRVAAAGQPVRNLAARNSPIYYLYAAVGYLAAYPADLTTRLMVMRAMTSVLLLGVVWLSVLTARRFSTDERFALIVGAVVGFHPATSLIFAGVNPDAALTLAATWSFWLMVRPVEAGTVVRRGWLIALSVGLAASIKSPGWFLVGPAVVWLWGQRTTLPKIRWWKMAGVGAMIAMVTGGGWLLAQSLRGSSDVINFFGAEQSSLSWNRILQNDLMRRPIIVWRTLWGHVGWSGVSRYSPWWVIGAMFIVFAWSSVGLLVEWIRRRAREKIRLAIMLGVGAITLEALYQWLYWQAGLRDGATHFPVHGRYYLPLIVPLALTLVAGARRLVPQRRGRLADGAVVLVVTGSLVMILAQAWSLYRFERLVGW